MKPLARFFIFALFSFSWPVMAASMVQQAVTNVGAFQTLSVQGRINVLIQARKKVDPASSVTIFGDPQSVRAVEVSSKDRQLLLKTHWDYFPSAGSQLSVRVMVAPAQLKKIVFASKGRLTGCGLSGQLKLFIQKSGAVDLHTEHLNLNTLVLDNDAQVTLQGIHSDQLNISGRNDGHVKLTGIAHLDTVDLTGNGQLSLYWVNSPRLMIRLSDHQTLLLAGVAETLDVQLKKEALFSGQFLRTKNGFIATSDQSIAKVAVKTQLNAITKNQSHIYYTQPAEFMNTYTFDRSTVLALD